MPELWDRLSERASPRFQRVCEESQNLPFSRQLSDDTAKCGGDVLKLHLFGPLQKAPQFFFGGHVLGGFSSSAWHGKTIPADSEVGKGKAYPFVDRGPLRDLKNSPPSAANVRQRKININMF